jgi:hypothetical protein
MIDTLMGRGFTQINADQIYKLFDLSSARGLRPCLLGKNASRCVVDYPARVMESQGEIPQYSCLFIAFLPLPPCPRVPVSVLSRR